MPPNLGGFFMVRSYYPSECHADYFDFERIEALKPAIEACRSEERFSRNAETDLVCRLLLEKKKENNLTTKVKFNIKTATHLAANPDINDTAGRVDDTKVTSTFRC